RAVDNANNVGSNTSFTWTIDTAPSVLSIVRSNPANATITGGDVTFRVLFSENVTGVDTTDFVLIANGTSRSIVFVLPVSTTPYDVFVNGMTGNGSLALRLVDDDSIKDASNLSLGGAGVGNGNFTGQAYTLDSGIPTANIIDITPDPRNTAVGNVTV